MLALHAPIFHSYKGQVPETLSALGGTSVYSTPTQVNGAPGTLSAYSFTRQTAAELSAALTARLKLPPVPRGTTGFLTYQADNRVQRILVLPSADNTDACVVLLFDQSVGDTQRAAKAEATWPNGLGAMPGTPRFSASCDNTRTTFVTAETHGTPEDAAESAAAVLRAQGWKETPASTPTFRLFSERNRFCAVFASRDPKTGETTLSIIQRNGSR